MNKEKRYLSITSIRWICFLLIFLFSAKQNHAQTASEVVKQSEDKMTGNTFQGTITIKMIRPSWSREMTSKIWLKEENYALILVLSPEKNKGIAFLKRQKEIWNWLPTLEKTIKLPPSMMSQPWMGTDFKNDYLVKASSLRTDFDQAFGKDSTVDGKTCWQLILTPKTNATVVWGKVILFIDKTEYLQLLNLYYDEGNELINTMHSTNIQKMGGRNIPTVIEMTPSDKPGNKTVIVYNAVVFNQPIADEFFTIQNMKQIK